MKQICIGVVVAVCLVVVVGNGMAQSVSGMAAIDSRSGAFTSSYRLSYMPIRTPFMASTYRLELRFPPWSSITAELWFRNYVKDCYGLGKAVLSKGSMDDKDVVVVQFKGHVLVLALDEDKGMDIVEGVYKSIAFLGDKGNTLIIVF